MELQLERVTTMDIKRERTVNRLRGHLNVWDGDDETLLKQTDGSSLRARVEAQIALEDFSKVVSCAFTEGGIKIGDAFLKVGRCLRGIKLKRKGEMS